MNGKEVYNALPQIVKTILILSEGWLVGGALDDIKNGVAPKDYDVIIPFNKWQVVVNTLRHTDCIEHLNSFGGFKYHYTGSTFVSLDIWPSSLDDHLKNANRLGYFYSMKVGLLNNHTA